MRDQFLRVIETGKGLVCHMVSAAQFKRGTLAVGGFVYQIKDGPLCHIQAPKHISPEVAYQLADDWYLQWQSDGEPNRLGLANRVAAYPKPNIPVPVGRAGGGDNGP